ncbi:MAG TPA: 4-hydroxy-tetrahydrodipicolinate synthase, partial [Spirochaetia bacterium]|nr:4-hydroxy-tetrahydrodipicolinate synthase [Spirochaetia bacterium]
MKPTGIIPAMVTPFTESQTVDENAIERLVERFLEVGVHGLFILGTNGEFFSLTAEEKVRIAQIVVARVAGRIPVYAGTGGISTRETIELSKQMGGIGVDALSVITPYFLPLTQDDLLAHYVKISESVELPIVLYNIPSRTGIHLHPRTVAELSQLDNIVGIKDSSGNFEMVVEYISQTEPDFSVLCGTDSLVLWGLQAGASGAIASTANLVPEIALDIYRCFHDGDLAKARRRQLELNKVRTALQVGGSPPIALKAAMNLFGFSVGPPRSPLRPIDPEETRKLQQQLGQFVRNGGGVLDAEGSN